MVGKQTFNLTTTDRNRSEVQITYINEAWLNGLQCHLVTVCGAGSNPAVSAKIGIPRYIRGSYGCPGEIPSNLF